QRRRIVSAEKRQQGFTADGEKHDRQGVNVDNTLHIGSSLIEPGMNEHLLRCFQTIIASYFSSREIHGDDIARGHEAQTRLLRSSSFDKNFIFAWDPSAHVTAGLLG